MVLSDSIRANVLRTSSSAATLLERKFSGCSDDIELALELFLLVGADNDEPLSGTGGGYRLSRPRPEKCVVDGRDSDTERR